MHGRMRGLRGSSLVQRTYVYGGVSATHLVSWSCGHAHGFVVAPRASRTPRNAVWPWLCDPSVHGALGVMAVCEPGWANL